jgi:hypothetical protein
MRAVPWDISICGGEVGFFLHGLGERVLSEKRSRCASLAGPVLPEDHRTFGSPPALLTF